MEKKTWSTHPILCVFLPYLFCTSKVVGGQNMSIRVDDYGDMALHCNNLYTTHHHYKTRLLLINRNFMGDVNGQAAAVVDLLKNVEVQAIIAPAPMFSGQASFLISLGQVPIITFSATSPSLTSTIDSSQVEAIGALVKAFGWREVVDSEFRDGIIPYLTDALEQVNAHIPYRCVATDDQIVAQPYKLMTMQTRVFIIDMLSPLASLLFTITKQKGMMRRRDYAWIITDGITDEFSSMNTSAIESMLGVKPCVPKTKELDDFTTRYKRRNNPYPRGRARDLDIFGLQAYESAKALAIADPNYQEANISRNSTDLEGFGVSYPCPDLFPTISSTTFIGLAGNFNLVDGQLQSPPYEIVKMAGPGSRCIGYWTKEKGIVKDLNFTSAKSNLEWTKWSADVSSSPKGWMSPTNGKTLRVRMPVKPGFDVFTSLIINSTKVEGYRMDVFNAVTASFRTWNSNKSTKVEGYRVDVFNAVMASLPIGFLAWVLEHQINKYFGHPFLHQLGMTMWFAFSAFVFSHFSSENI